MTKDVKTTAKDFFLWLATVGALYVSVVSLVALLFEYINRLFGDPLTYSHDPFSAGIRTAMAALIIVFPAFIWLTRILNEDLRHHHEKKDLWVRRWLLMLTLFIAGITIVINLIVLINTYLGGQELTLAFILKVLTVLVVAGGTFLYYYHDLRGTWEKNERLSIRIGGGIAAFVVLTVISGFFIIGSPQSLREIRFDQQKVLDLQEIQWQITNNWQRTEELPADLEALTDPLRGFSVPRDPQTGELYEYRVISEEELTFELCADFNRPSPDWNADTPGTEAPVTPQPRPVYDRYGMEFWQHDEGQTCFERTIDPEQYPPHENRPR